MLSIVEIIWRASRKSGLTPWTIESKVVCYAFIQEPQYLLELINFSLEHSIYTLLVKRTFKIYFKNMRKILCWESSKYLLKISKVDECIKLSFMESKIQKQIVYFLNRINFLPKFYFYIKYLFSYKNCIKSLS